MPWEHAYYLISRNLPQFLCTELIERSYGTDCRIYTPEKSNKFSNVYVSTQFVIVCKFKHSISLNHSYMFLFMQALTTYLHRGTLMPMLDILVLATLILIKWFVGNH